MLPDVVVLDPVATATMPVAVTVATGLDAFVHAVEAVTGQRRTERPPEPALRAVGLVVEHLPRAVAQGDDLGRGRACRRPPTWRGRPSTAAGPASPTPSATRSGSLYHVPHGVAVAIGLEAALDWNVEGAPDLRSGVATALGVELDGADGRRRPTARCGRAAVCPPQSPPCLPIAHRRRRPSPRPWWRRRTCPCSATTAGPPTGDDAAAGRSHRRRVDRASTMTGMSLIVRIDISHHRLPLDPPFPASWDTRPRTYFPATIVRVTDSDGRVGVGSGDAMYGFEDYGDQFLGQDPLDLERHHAVLSNIDFHAGRPWPMDVALWDLAGQIHERPVWHLLGGRGRRVRVYASSGVHRPVAAMVELARRVRSAGFPALKVRFGRPDPADDLAVVHAVRDAVGDDARADGRLQPGLAHAVGHRATVDGGSRHPGRGSARGRVRVLDGGTAPPWGLRRARRAAAAGGHPHRRR